MSEEEKNQHQFWSISIRFAHWPINFFFILSFCSVCGVKKCNFSVFRMSTFPMVWLLNYKFEFTLQDIESVLYVPMTFYPHCKCKCKRVLGFGPSFPSWISFFIILFLIGRVAIERERVRPKGWRCVCMCRVIRYSDFSDMQSMATEHEEPKRDSISGMKSVRLARIPQFTYTHTHRETQGN